MKVLFKSLAAMRNDPHIQLNENFGTGRCLTPDCGFDLDETWIGQLVEVQEGLFLGRTKGYRYDKYTIPEYFVEEVYDED